MIDCSVLSFPACEYFITASSCSLFLHVCLCFLSFFDIFSVCLIIVHGDIIHKS